MTLSPVAKLTWIERFGAFMELSEVNVHNNLKSHTKLQTHKNEWMVKLSIWLAINKILELWIIFTNGNGKIELAWKLECTLYTIHNSIPVKNGFLHSFKRRERRQIISFVYLFSPTTNPIRFKSIYVQNKIHCNFSDLEPWKE